MEQIKICCTSGITLPFENIDIYPGDLKKHSLIEIERMCESIIDNGFLFPLAIGKVKDKNYIIDGECVYYALEELEYRGYKIPEIPVFFVRTKESTIKRNILLATSTNHCVTENSLKEFVKETDLNLKKYAFNTPDLIDFHTVDDLGLYIDTNGGKFSEQKLNSKDFEDLLK